MIHCFQLNEKVKVRAGNQTIYGAVSDMDKDRKYYLITTEYGTQLLESEGNIEPDRDHQKLKGGYKKF